VGEPDQLGQLVVAGEDDPLGEVATDVASLLDEEVGGGFKGGGWGGPWPRGYESLCGKRHKTEKRGGVQIKRS